MPSLKQKTISGLLWSFIDNFANLGIAFIVGIILARLLTPKDFGLIGMIAIFIAISETFVNSGFSQALIRKNNCTQADYSTVFYYNLAVGIFIYLLLFFSAEYISRFFGLPQLKLLVQVLGIGLIINSLTITQQTLLTKRIDFKLKARISVISVICSGIVGTVMAFQGYGVWSLVGKTISSAVFSSLLLWSWNKWKPSLVFSKKSFKDLFSFGSRLLASGLIDTVYRNIYNLIIGKYFSASELGFFIKADQIKTLPSQNITGIIQRVSYPVLSSINEDTPRLKSAYRRLITGTMFISFVCMIGLASMAEPLVITLIGEPWRPSIIYLQLLCFVGMFYPLHALNLNMLQVQGRSDLFLKLEIIKKILAIPTIILGVIFGIKILIVGMIANTLIAYYLNSHWSGKFIGYSIGQQVKDILPSFFIAALVGFMVYFTGNLLETGFLVKLIIQLILWVVLTIGIAEGLRLDNYRYMKNIILEKVFNR